MPIKTKVTPQNGTSEMKIFFNSQAPKKDIKYFKLTVREKLPHVKNSIIYKQFTVFSKLLFIYSFPILRY